MAGRPQGSTNLPKIRSYISKGQIEKLVRLCLKSALVTKDVTMQKFLVEQIFGKAPQTMDLTSGGEKIIPIYGGVSKHNSDKKNIQTNEENKGSLRRNMGE